MGAGGLGVVVIGRNEGERLRACLASLRDVPVRVYVDSGSTDQSCELARDFGFDVVELPPQPAFTAARARNAGFAHLLEAAANTTYVQMVDGDCEVRSEWLDVAVRELSARSDLAVVFGRRRERHPDRNCYHRACDHEWRVPAGDVNSCGGDALFRVSALLEVGGYNPLLIAGEEPDLCLRLRQNGWKIRSNNREMTWHDIAMTRFSQWWRRAMRAGFAFAELTHIHGARADPAWRRLILSALAWTVVLTLSVFMLPVALAFNWAPGLAMACGLMLLVLAQIFRVAVAQEAQLGGFAGALRWSGLIMAAKVAQAAGLARYHVQRWRKRGPAIIEYK